MLKNLQALRAVAALLVIVYHMRLMTPFNRGLSLEFGQAGVDIFFVISGFIIAHITRSGPDSDARIFLTRRLVRIAPLYWALTLAVYLGALALPFLLSNGPATPLDLLRSLLFIPYAEPNGEIQPIVYMGWSLNYEMLFYLMFTAALAAPIRRPDAVLAVVLVGLVVLGAVFRPRGVFGVTYTDPRLLEFVAGMGLARLLDRFPSRLGRGAQAAVLAVVLAAVVCLPLGDRLWPGLPFVLKWGGPAVLIVGGALVLERSGAVLGWGWLMLLGDASYAIYLSHPFVVKAGDLVMRKLPGLPVAAQLGADLAVLGVVLAVGMAIRLMIEAPLLAWLGVRLGVRRPRPLATALHDSGLEQAAP